MQELKGICSALNTPFKKGGEKLDENALRKLIDSMVKAGVHIILVCGGTGEFAYLRPEERKRIAEIASEHIDGRVKLMVQTSAINTVDAIEYSKHAENVGAECLLVLPPYFEGPDDKGVIYHYEKISEAVEIPIMVYNIPVHSGFDITPNFFERLLDIDNVSYIKDSTSDLVRIQQLIACCDKKGKGKVFNGADPLVFHSLLEGCVGCVLGAANVMPVESVQIYELINEGKISEALTLWRKMLPANIFFWTHVYNSAVKAATNLSGIEVGPCRYPVQPLTDEEMRELKKCLEPLGI